MHKIIFTAQKTFNDLKGIGGFKLRYDFYLPNYNLLIEYQGIQHETPVDLLEKEMNLQKEHSLINKNTINVNVNTQNKII